MTRRPNRLSDTDLGRLLARMPDPPPPAADLTDRIVANAVGANAAARRAPRRLGRRIWWAIAILGAAGAVTAAAANAGRFEFARVLAWPQEIARAAGWAPHHRRGALLVRAERPAPPRPEAAAEFAAMPAAGAHPLAPPAMNSGERIARIGAPRLPPFGGPDRIERPLRPLARPRPEARLAIALRRATVPPVARTETAENHPALAAPLARPAPLAQPAPAAARHGDVDRAAKDDALRFHDADEYARRQVAPARDWRAPDDQPRRALTADADNRARAADRGDHRWAENGPHRLARPQSWRQRADNRPFHPFRPHGFRGRRRG